MSGPILTPEIRTRSGLLVNLAEPTADSININDIAHHLSQICRYTGATPWPYSVALHCLNVGLLLPPKWRLEGLLHDAAEAYITDVSSPLKSLLPNYRDLENAFDKLIFEKYGLAYPMRPEVKDADIVMLITEKHAFWPDAKPSQREQDAGYPSHVPPADIAEHGLHLQPVAPNVVRRMFLEAFHTWRTHYDPN